MDGGVSANNRICENRGSRQLPLQRRQEHPSQLYVKIFSAETEEECLEFFNEARDELRMFNSYFYNINKILNFASTKGYARVARRVLEFPEVDIHSAPGGWSPLIRAALYGHEEVASVLILAGADVNIRSHEENMTPLHWAAYNGRSRVVQVLLETKGVQLNPLDQDGKTPLHHACSWNHPKVVRQLLEAGANPNIRDNKDRTPFTLLLNRCRTHLEEIKLFLQHGSYIEAFHYQKISQDSVLKENILKDVDLCALSVINRYHFQSLPALKGVPRLEGKLPCIDNFKLSATHISDVKSYVRQDIQANTFCNVVGLRPYVLRMMCVEALLSS